MTRPLREPSPEMETFLTALAVLCTNHGVALYDGHGCGIVAGMDSGERAEFDIDFDADGPGPERAVINVTDSYTEE